MLDPVDIEAIATDAVLLAIARRAIEDALIVLRDARISMLNRANGLVVRECDGTDSRIIRLSPEEAVSIGLRAIAAHLTKRKEVSPDAEPN